MNNRYFYIIGGFLVLLFSYNIIFSSKKSNLNYKKSKSTSISDDLDVNNKSATALNKNNLNHKNKPPTELKFANQQEYDDYMNQKDREQYLKNLNSHQEFKYDTEATRHIAFDEDEWKNKEQSWIRKINKSDEPLELTDEEQEFVRNWKKEIEGK